MVRAHFAVTDLVVNGDESEDVYDFRDVDELSSAQEDGPIVVNVVDTNHASDAVEFLQSAKLFMGFLLLVSTKSTISAKNPSQPTPARLHGGNSGRPNVSYSQF
jgi:hypothetical protein